MSIYIRDYLPVGLAQRSFIPDEEKWLGIQSGWRSLSFSLNNKPLTGLYKEISGTTKCE